MPLLEIKGEPLLEGDQPILDEKFLLEVMEFNEDLDDADCQELLLELKDKISETLEELHQVLKSEFSKNEVTKAKFTVAKMQYFHNLRHKIKDKEFELGIVN